MNTLYRTENRELTLQAREALRGRWGLAIAANLVYCVIVMGVQNIPRFGWGLGIIVGAPLAVGISKFFLSVARRQEPQLAQLFDGIRIFLTSLGTYLLSVVFILLWTLLFIIPGIMACFSYAMIYFILADDESAGPLEAIARSKAMMRGNRWKFFCLTLRFIGWALLCILTLGIGFLWLLPYMGIAYARFYDDIRPVAEESSQTAPAQALTAQPL